MLKFYANKFVGNSANLGKFSFLLNQIMRPGAPPLPPQDLDLFRKMVDQVIDFLRETNLNFSLQEAERLKKLLNLAKPEYPFIHQSCETLLYRMDDELRHFSAFVIPQQNLDFYEKTNLFGENVFNSFPSSNFDIEEAGKCLALARYTACVMHLQRVIEVGLKSYWKLLGVTISTPQPSWHTVLDKTAKEIKERNDKAITTKVWKSDIEKDFCESVQPFLVAVKSAWRNPSMHADAKYTEEEAKEIYNAVKSFMRNLAEHLNEKGKFTAKKRK